MATHIFLRIGLDIKALNFSPKACFHLIQNMFILLSREQDILKMMEHQHLHSQKYTE
jgi:hypothetical protein